MGLAEGTGIFYSPASFGSASEIRAASFAVFSTAAAAVLMRVVVVSGWSPFHAINSFSFPRTISHLTFRDGDIKKARQFDLKGQRQPYW